MCILFAYINNDAGEGEYQVVIANNRDEDYDRPTAPAARWENDPCCISGIDLCTHVPKGGTWIGLSSRTRKIASLLNISQADADPDPTMKGRGCLVTRYISDVTPAEEYMSNLKQHAAEYNPFNLLLIEQHPDKKWQAYYYSKSDENSPFPITDKCFGISNSAFTIPWKKVQNGTTEFNDIIAEHSSVSSKEQLTNDLIQLLNSKTSHLPDEHLEANAPKGLTKVVEMGKLNQARSCINVDLPEARYGSRTNTVLLIDGKGQGQYMERTMVEPVDGANPKWATNTINFTLGEAVANI